MPSRMREAAMLMAQNSSPDGQIRIEAAERDGHGEGRDGVAGGKRELIGRQQCGPAVRLKGAGPLASGGLLQIEEDGDSQGGG